MQRINKLSLFLLPLALATTAACSDDNTKPPPVVPECDADSDCASNDCNETTGQCVDVPVETCTQISVSNFAIDPQGIATITYSAEMTDVDTEGALDVFAVEFWNYEGSATDGEVDLASEGINDNYATCSECILIFADIDSEEGGVGKYYFQESGTLTLEQNPYELNLNATISGLKLVEVTLNEKDATSTPVAGGSCIELVDDSVSANYVGWTCDYATTYGTDGDCDCACGAVVDPDCQAFEIPAVTGCQATETCGPEGSCIAACDAFAANTCTTGNCVPRNLTQFADSDYCETDATLIDTAAIGATCVDQVNTFFCNLDAGVAKGYCNDDGEGIYVCQRVCRVGGTDCGGGEVCEALFDAANPHGTCLPAPAPTVQ